MPRWNLKTSRSNALRPRELLRVGGRALRWTLIGLVLQTGSPQVVGATSSSTSNKARLFESRHKARPSASSEKDPATVGSALTKRSRVGAKTDPNPLVLRDVDDYIRAVKNLPRLDQKQEIAAARAAQQGDSAARHRLVNSLLHFVVYVARGYGGYGLPLADLIQEGNVGLLKAIERFDPDRNVRLVSYAVDWIRAEIGEYVLRNWRIVRVATSKAQRKLFFHSRELTDPGRRSLTDADAATIAEKLDVRLGDVLEMGRRLAATDMDFDGPAFGGKLDGSLRLRDVIRGPDTLAQDIEAQHHRAATVALNAALETLGERDREIITRRHLAESKSTLHELAAELGVSAERVRQLEAEALKKLRRVPGLRSMALDLL